MAPCGLLTLSSCLAVAKSGFVDGVGGLGPRVHASIAPKVHVAGHLCIFVSARGEVGRGGSSEDEVRRGWGEVVQV